MRAKLETPSMAARLHSEYWLEFDGAVLSKYGLEKLAAEVWEWFSKADLESTLSRLGISRPVS